MNDCNFWTDELVAEYTTWKSKNGGVWINENIAKFKEYILKQQSLNNQDKAKQILFTTEDNVAIYEEGVIVWLVKDDKDYSCSGYSFRKEYLNLPTWHLFSTEDAAKEYVIYNKPILTLKECMDAMGAYKLWNPIQRLKDLAQFKINQ